MGIPFALVAVSLLACLAVALLPGGGADSGPPTAASTVASRTNAPATADTRIDAMPSAARPQPTSPPPASPTAPASRSAGSGTHTTATPASRAGRIKPSVTYQGVATSYDAGDGAGACLYGPSGDVMIAAMNHTDYESAKACGAYVLVRAANGASITVRIVNECPLPCAPGQLDLSHEAFAKLADLSRGRLPITWNLVSPGTPGTISIRYKAGSTKWWCGIQVIGHRNPVATLEVRTTNGWRRLSRTDYNYFLSPDGSGCGGAIRVTDIYGEQLTIDGVAVRPDVAQPADVQFARH
ncbi:expansin EXLX1 family cellulose-binding protein [Streptomyces sp. NPDC001415]